MFKWVERSTLTEYSHEMIHYRNAMVKEVNFVFSDSFGKIESNRTLQEEFERLKDFREKTGNRIQKDTVRNKVWIDMLVEIFRTTLDFTAAELYLKYFNIPNEAICADFYFLMKESQSVYMQLIKDEAYNSAFQFLHLFPASDALAEFEYLLKTAIDKNNSPAVLFLVENINSEPYDMLLKVEETRQLLTNEYDKAEKEKKVVEARKLAEVLNDSDRIKRVNALDAMISNNHTEAFNILKEIHEISGMKPVIKEFYGIAMEKGKAMGDTEDFKIAFSYALYGKLSEDDDKRYLQEPAGKLFEYYLSRPTSGEADYFEADKYREYCSEQLVQDVVAKKMLDLIQNSDRATAKHLKNRFKIEFKSGEYKFEEEIKKFYRNLTETYGTYDVPKGEENLLTALDVVVLYNFHKEDIESVKFLLCKFYLVNKIFESAKRFYVEGNKELYELVIKQLNTFIGTRDFNGAYDLVEAIPVQLHRSDREEKRIDVKRLSSYSEITLRDLAMSIVLDDIFQLKVLRRSYYQKAFVQGLNSGPDGIQFLVDLNRPFKNRMEACSKIRLANTIKRLIAQDKISADILRRTYEKFIQPDILDYIAYFLKRLFGFC